MQLPASITKRCSPSIPPTPKPAASGPPDGDPKVFLTKATESGKGAEEQSKEAKSGKDDRMVWASNRIERDRTNANYNSGPVTIFSKAIITRDPETAKAVFDDEAKRRFGTTDLRALESFETF